MIDPRVEEDFRATGLSHLTAVSGENVAMFLAPNMGLGMLIGLGRRGRFMLGIASVGFFVVLTRGEPSVLRAAVMSGLTMLGIFLGRPRSPPAIVGGAVLLLLGLDPSLVYAMGFQLSVAATVGMALLATPIADRVRFLPRGIALAAATTLAAQAGVSPLLLYHFGVVPTVSLPANLLAFPAVGAGMNLGLAAAACGLVARPGGVVLGVMARLPLGYRESLADRLRAHRCPRSRRTLDTRFRSLLGLFCWLGQRGQSIRARRSEDGSSSQWPSSSRSSSGPRRSGRAPHQPSP